jgi:hypothetical protein
VKLWLATFLTMTISAMNLTIAFFAAERPETQQTAFVFLFATVITLSIMLVLATVRDSKRLTVDRSFPFPLITLGTANASSTSHNPTPEAKQ